MKNKGPGSTFIKLHKPLLCNFCHKRHCLTNMSFFKKEIGLAKLRVWYTLHLYLKGISIRNWSWLKKNQFGTLNLMNKKFSYDFKAHCSQLIQYSIVLVPDLLVNSHLYVFVGQTILPLSCVADLTILSSPALENPSTRLLRAHISRATFTMGLSRSFRSDPNVTCDNNDKRLGDTCMAWTIAQYLLLD